MSRPIRFIGYAMPAAHGRVYCLSISNQFRCHAYHIISKWKDIVINKNHLFTSRWSLFSLLIPFEKPPYSSFLCYFREYSRITDYHFTVIGLYLPGEVFFTRISCGQVRIWWKNGEGRTRTCMSEFLRLAYPYRPHLHNRHQTVSTRIYRAMRDTIWFLFTTIRQNTRWLFLTWSLHTSDVQESNLPFLSPYQVRLSVSSIETYAGTH